MSQLDTTQMFETLLECAKGYGVRSYGITKELLEAFGCADGNEFLTKLWVTCRAIRGNSSNSTSYKQVMAAMYILDQIPMEEQPVRIYARRARIIEETFRVRYARPIWLAGLQLLVDNFEAVNPSRKVHHA